MRSGIMQLRPLLPAEGLEVNFGIIRRDQKHLMRAHLSAIEGVVWMPWLNLRMVHADVARGVKRAESLNSFRLGPVSGAL